MTMLRMTIPVLAALMAGCVWLDDNRGSVDITLDAEQVPEDLQCIRGCFPIKFNDYDADSPFDGYTRIRMFESISLSTETNFMSIVFVDEDPETLEKCPRPVAGGSYEITRAGCVRVSIQLNGFREPKMLDKWAESKENNPKPKKCERPYTIYMTGTLDIGELSMKKDRRVSGKYSGRVSYYRSIRQADKTIVEKVVPLGDIEGSFSFVNHAGAVWDN